MDPHAVLGVSPGASPEEVRRAYRALAKRFHPDRAGQHSSRLMASINAAYEMLRDGAPVEEPVPPGSGGDREPRKAAGWWLSPAVRRVLAPELLVMLDEGEEVAEVVLTATGDAHDVQLAVTDRRLLWLRDDAIVGRVRSLRYRDMSWVQARRPGRLRRSAELRAETSDGRRVRFFELPYELADRLAAAVSAHAVRRLV